MKQKLRDIHTSNPLHKSGMHPDAANTARSGKLLVRIGTFLANLTRLKETITIWILLLLMVSGVFAQQAESSIRVGSVNRAAPILESMGLGIGYRWGDHQVSVLGGTSFTGGRDFQLGLEYSRFLPPLFSRFDYRLSASFTFHQVRFLSGRGAFVGPSYALLYQVSPVISYHFFKQLSVFAGVGFSFAQYHLYENDGGQRIGTDYGAVVQGGLDFYIPLKKSEEPVEKHSLPELRRHALGISVSWLPRFTWSPSWQEQLFYQFNASPSIGFVLGIEAGLGKYRKGLVNLGEPIAIYGLALSFRPVIAGRERFSFWGDVTFGIGKRDFVYGPTPEAFSYRKILLGDGLDFRILDGLCIQGRLQFGMLYFDYFNQSRIWNTEFEFEVGFGLKYELPY